MSVKHPSLWVFIRHLKDAQSATEVAIDHERSGDPAPKQKKKWRVRNRRIKQLQRRYARGAVDVTQYWNAISYLTPNF